MTGHRRGAKAPRCAPLSALHSRMSFWVYLHGYQRRVLPRWIRRTFACTQFHRAWLSGFHGRFEEAGVMYGPANPYPTIEQRIEQEKEKPG